MKKERNTVNLKDKSLKKNPFSVPEGYFENFSERLQKRIREEEVSEVPLRRIGTARFRIAIAAAVLGVALISYSVIRFTVTNSDAPGFDPDIALLEQLYMIDDESYLFGLMDSETEELDEEEAFANQAIDYLAINDVETVLFFE
jgi:hypothetical protein